MNKTIYKFFWVKTNLLKYSNSKHLDLGIWQHSNYFCSIFQEVSFYYHQRNVKSWVSVSAFTASLSFEVWARSRSSEVTVSTASLIHILSRNMGLIWGMYLGVMSNEIGQWMIWMIRGWMVFAVSLELENVI